jgi:hypothetical protein
MENHPAGPAEDTNSEEELGARLMAIHETMIAQFTNMKETPM